jgi:hypothetical protein
MSNWSHKLLEAAVMIFAAAFLLDMAWDLLERLVPVFCFVAVIAAIVRWRQR